jgi:preprotein translocase subunit YajC
VLKLKIKLLTAIAVVSIASNAFAQNAGGGAQSPTQSFGFFLPLILIFGIFYFLIIRPQQKQAKKHQEMLKEIKKGDLVITSGGIHGRIVGTADNILTVEIADNCKVKIERNGVQSLKLEAKPE